MNLIADNPIEQTNIDITEVRASVEYIETIIDIYSNPNRKIPTLVQQILDNNRLPEIRNIPYPFLYHIDRLWGKNDLLIELMIKLKEAPHRNEFLALLYQAMELQLKGSKII